VKARTLPPILDNHQPLRGKGHLLSPYEWPPKPDTEVPRALRSLARIIDGGLCHRCGSCIGICPTKVLSTDSSEYPVVTNLSACTDCDLCVKVCPGDELAYGPLLTSLERKVSAPEDTHGSFIKGVVAHATDAEIREHSTSGGVVTALLIDLLERGEIEGAMVIGSSHDPLWKGRPFIARSKDELLSAMKSKYAIAPTNVSFQEIRDIPGKYAAVGLPCQIHGVVKARSLDPKLRERIVLTIALFCHAAIEHEAFELIWEHLGEEARGAQRFISRVGKHPGTPYIERADGSLYPVYFGKAKKYRPTSIEMINILYRLYTPERCLTCFDSTGEFADIAVGDPWMSPPEPSVDFYKGWSFAIIRSKKAHALIDSLQERERLRVVDLTELETRASNRMMATEKKWRAFRVIETLRRQGRPVPEYGFSIPRHPSGEFFKTEVHMLTHVFCYLPQLRASVLRFMLSSWGYWLLRANSWRRGFRNWRRDFKTRLVTKVRGRR
jgi:coenzyme F420 hydrogenase subunit beta